MRTLDDFAAEAKAELIFPTLNLSDSEVPADGKMMALDITSLLSHNYLAYKCAVFYGGAWNLVGDVRRSMSWLTRDIQNR